MRCGTFKGCLTCLNVPSNIDILIFSTFHPQARSTKLWHPHPERIWNCLWKNSNCARIFPLFHWTPLTTTKRRYCNEYCEHVDNYGHIIHFWPCFYVLASCSFMTLVIFDNLIIVDNDRRRRRSTTTRMAEIGHKTGLCIGQRWVAIVASYECWWRKEPILSCPTNRYVVYPLLLCMLFCCEKV